MHSIQFFCRKIAARFRLEVALAASIAEFRETESSRAKIRILVSKIRPEFSSSNARMTDELTKFLVLRNFLRDRPASSTGIQGYVCDHAPYRRGSVRHR